MLLIQITIEFNCLTVKTQKEQTFSEEKSVVMNRLFRSTTVMKYDDRTVLLAWMHIFWQMLVSTWIIELRPFPSGVM